MSGNDLQITFEGSQQSMFGWVNEAPFFQPALSGTNRGITAYDSITPNKVFNLGQDVKPWNHW